MSTRIPGEPAEGTPYDSGFDRTTIQNPDTQLAAGNWTEDGFSANFPEGYDLGFTDNYLICDYSGFRVTVDEGLVQNYYGWKTRQKDWEPRHPQDLVRTRTEDLRGSERPEQDDVFLATNEVTADSL